MNLSKRTFVRLFVFLFLFVAQTGRAYAPHWADEAGLEGYYAGTLELVFDRARKVNIEVSLANTGETEFIQTGPNVFKEQKVIDGAFVIDDEGGPYAFTRVTFNRDKSELDLRYNRRQLSLGTGGAGDFRLVGTFDETGKLTGRVLGGTRGPLGKFTLAPVKRDGLETVRKYDGVWSGIAQMIPLGRRPIRIVISAGLAEVLNPPDWEFGFTPGKMAHFNVDGIKFSFNNIVVDYLRQRIFLSDIDAEGRSLMTAELDVDFGESATMRGSLYGIYKGKSADLGLRRAR